MSRSVMVRMMLQMTDAELASFLAVWVKPTVLQQALNIIVEEKEWNGAVDIKAWEHVKKEGEPGPRFGS